MADKTAFSYDVKFEWLFADGDTRVQTMQDPISQITTEQITDLETLILNGGGSSPTLIIGDKAGAPFRRINTVVQETKTTTILDLGLS